MISKFEFFHGAVLARIIRKDSATRIKQIESTEDRAVYEVNSKRLIIKYKQGSTSKKELRWSFAFTRRDLESILNDKKTNVALIGTSDTVGAKNMKAVICFLEYEQIEGLLGKPDDLEQQHTVEVAAPPRQGLKVSIRIRDVGMAKGTRGRKSAPLTIRRKAIEDFQF